MSDFQFVGRDASRVSHSSVVPEIPSKASGIVLLWAEHLPRMVPLNTGGHLPGTHLFTFHSACFVMLISSLLTVLATFVL